MIMWFSCLVSGRVVVNQTLKNKLCRHEQINQNRKKRSTNMPCGLLKELQALIAFACYNSPTLIKRGASLSEGAIEDVMTSIFYGDDKNGADPNLITYVDQFLLGLNNSRGCTHSHCKLDQMVHLEKLYCQFRSIYTVTRSFFSTSATDRLRRRYCRRSHCLGLERRFQAVHWFACRRRYCATAKNDCHSEIKKVTIQRWYITLRNKLGRLYIVVFG